MNIIKFLSLTVVLAFVGCSGGSDRSSVESKLKQIAFPENEFELPQGWQYHVSEAGNFKAAVPIDGSLDVNDREITSPDYKIQVSVFEEWQQTPDEAFEEATRDPYGMRPILFKDRSAVGDVQSLTYAQDQGGSFYGLFKIVFIGRKMIRVQVTYDLSNQDEIDDEARKTLFQSFQVLDR